MRTHSTIILQEEGVNANKTSEILFFSSLQFLMTDLYDLFDVQNWRENRSKNKLVCENALACAQGSYSLATGYGLLIAMSGV